MSHPAQMLRVVGFAAAAIVAAAVIGSGGCSHNSAMPGPTGSPKPSPSPSPSGSPTSSPSPAATANVFVSMAYASMSPTIDPTYGQVDGYALISPPPTPVSSPSPSPSPTPTETPGASGIVNVPCNVNIQFLNFDKTSPHTASLLSAGGGFPPYFNNNNGITASPSLTPLSANQFSSGFVTIDAGSPAASAVYSTGAVPGVYYFGDYYNYSSSPSMRTVIIVHC